MLMDLLNKAVTVAMLGFVVSSMLAMGSAHSLVGAYATTSADTFTPYRRWNTSTMILPPDARVRRVAVCQIPLIWNFLYGRNKA
jgi:hypothetical protein